MALRSPHSAVFVLDANGQRLMPASPGRIRRLLDDGKATPISDPSFFVVALTHVVTQPVLTPILLGITVRSSQISFFVISRDTRRVRVQANIILPLGELNKSPYVEQVAAIFDPSDVGPLAFIYDEYAPALQRVGPLFNAIYERLAALAPISHIAFYQEQGRDHPSTPQQTRLSSSRHLNSPILHEILPHRAAYTGIDTLTQRFLMLSGQVPPPPPSHVACVVIPASEAAVPYEGSPYANVIPEVAPPYVILTGHEHNPDAAHRGSVATVRLRRSIGGRRRVRWGIIVDSELAGRYHLLVPNLVSSTMNIAWQRAIVERADVEDIFVPTSVAILPVSADQSPTSFEGASHE